MTAVVLDDAERRTLRRKARRATLDALRALGGEAQRETIHKWALDHAGLTLRELAAAPPKGAAKKYLSLVDHQLSWALTDLKREGLVENPKRSTWRMTSLALPANATAVGEPVEAERLAELRTMPYRLYLRTPEWRRTRAAALLRAGYSCSLDVTHTDSLEVHHRTYERRGAELVSDLVVLCHSCHQLHHKECGRLPRELSAASPPLAAATDKLAAASIVRPDKRPKFALLRRLFASGPHPSS